MPSNERSAQTQQSVNHFAVLARIVAGVILAASVIAVVFFAGFFTEREYGDLFAAFEDSLVPGDDTCIQTFCVPAGRAGQHCRQYTVPC